MDRNCIQAVAKLSVTHAIKYLYMCKHFFPSEESMIYIIVTVLHTSMPLTGGAFGETSS